MTKAVLEIYVTNMQREEKKNSVGTGSRLHEDTEEETRKLSVQDGVTETRGCTGEAEG